MEYFLNSERANLFAEAIEDIDRLIVPVISVYEVYKKIRRDRGDDDASRAVRWMQTGRIVEIDLRTVLNAATFRLPLADSLIYGVAIQNSATLWTQDAHFIGLPGVKYVPMQP